MGYSSEVKKEPLSDLQDLQGALQPPPPFRSHLRVYLPWELQPGQAQIISPEGDLHLWWGCFFAWDVKFLLVWLSGA